MQVILWDVEENTNRKRYSVNLNKNSILCYNPSKCKQNELIMAGDKITCSECTVQLGTSRNVKDKLNVEVKVSTGRKNSIFNRLSFHSVNRLNSLLTHYSILSYPNRNKII